MLAPHNHLRYTTLALTFKLKQVILAPSYLRYSFLFSHGHKSQSFLGPYIHLWKIPETPDSH